MRDLRSLDRNTCFDRNVITGNTYEGNLWAMMRLNILLQIGTDERAMQKEQTKTVTEDTGITSLQNVHGHAGKGF
jgi:hypothetical protein